MRDILGGLLLCVLCVTCAFVGFHFGHTNPPLLALVPIGVFCGVGGGFLMAGGMRR
jgi:hypothetical protein